MAETRRHVPPPEFADAVADARRAAGLSFADLAQAIGTSKGNAANLEYGTRSPSRTTAEALIRALNPTPDQARVIRAAAIAGVGRDRRARFR